MASKRGQNIIKILKSLATGTEYLLYMMEPHGRYTLNDTFRRYEKFMNEHEKYEWEKKFYNTFYYLRENGMIKVSYRGNQLYISLTEEGRKKAGKYKIDDLNLKKSKKWDKKWRILIFDIEDKQKIKREALRGKIKELGMFQLQKSVWVYPYDFSKEMKLLREFFGLTESEMNLIEAAKIENDQAARDYFGL